MTQEISNKKKVWIKYTMPTATGRNSYRVGKYVFTYDKNKNPIPVKVEWDIAKVLLILTEKPCNCHHVPNYKPKKIFVLVNNN